MLLLFVFASRRRHTIWPRDWSSDVCSSDLARQGGVVVVLHDLALAARYCDRLVLLQGGRVVAEGSAGQVLSADQLQSVYGIEGRWLHSDGEAAVLPWRRDRKSVVEGKRGGK